MSLMYLQERKLNAKNVVEWPSPYHFEIAIIMDFFLLISVTFVTRKWENKSAPIKLVTLSEIFNFLTLSLTLS